MKVHHLSDLIIFQQLDLQVLFLINILLKTKIFSLVFQLFFSKHFYEYFFLIYLYVFVNLRLILIRIFLFLQLGPFLNLTIRDAKNLLTKNRNERRDAPCFLCFGFDGLGYPALLMHRISRASAESTSLVFAYGDGYPSARNLST